MYRGPAASLPAAASRSRPSCGRSQVNAGLRPPRALPRRPAFPFEAEDGRGYRRWVTSLPERTRGWRGRAACIDAAHRIHARVEDAIRDRHNPQPPVHPSTRPGRPARLIAAILAAWLRLAHPRRAPGTGTGNGHRERQAARQSPRPAPAGDQRPHCCQRSRGAASPPGLGPVVTPAPSDKCSSS